MHFELGLYTYPKPFPTFQHGLDLNAVDISTCQDSLDGAKGVIELARLVGAVTEDGRAHDLFQVHAQFQLTPNLREIHGAQAARSAMTRAEHSEKF
jgi:hypothetical protein